MFAALFGIILRYPAAAGGALLCTWALDQWARSQDSYFVAHQGLSNYITSIAVMFAIVVRFFAGKPAFKPVTREYVVMLSMYLLATVSWLWSIDPDSTWTQLTGTYRTLVVFAVLLPLTVYDMADLKASLFALLTLGCFICLLVLGTSRFEGRLVMFETGGVFTEEGLTYGNPLAIASTAGYVTVLGMLLNFRGAARLWQVFRYVVIGCAFSLSMKSGSRGQTIAILIVIICFLPYSRRFKDLRSFATLVISSLLFGVITLYMLFTFAATDLASGSDRWNWSRFAGEYQESRIGTSLVVLTAWAESNPLHWLVGLGSSASFSSTLLGIYPHVVYAEVLAELGLVGWILLNFLFFFCAQNLRELWGYVKDDPEDRGLIAGLGGLVFFEIIMSSKQGSLLGSGPMMGLFTILGRLTVVEREKHARLAQLDAGMYAMSPADWNEFDEPYDAPAGEPAMARGG